MRRTTPALIAIIVIFCGLALYVFISRPVVVLPTVTMSMPEGVNLNAIPGLASIQAFNVTLRTNGTLSVGADGHTLAVVSYTPDSLINAVDLGTRVALPPSYRVVLFLVPILVLPWMFPQLAWSVFVTLLYLYYVLPLEVTLRFIHG